jgi:molybdopterin-guanine dinucleotide biosynthesis protein A
MPIAREHITGLLLAGGEGRRMGGRDKGLLQLHGQTLAARALARLEPQVGGVLVSANRNLQAYLALGWPVLSDDPGPAARGPLAGLLAGLRHCGTPYLLSVPCDTPGFPLDLAARLAEAVAAAGADIGMAASPAEPGGTPSPQPVFCLVSSALHTSLARFLDSGQRRVATWMAQHRCATVAFGDEAAFFNINRPDDLLRAEG